MLTPHTGSFGSPFFYRPGDAIKHGVTDAAPASLETAFSPDRPLLLIGCGRMGSALARGWLRAGLAAGALTIVEPAGRPDFAEPVVHIPRLEQVPAALAPTAIVLAVKPRQVPTVLQALPRFAGADTLLVSIAAGVPLARLCAVLAASVRAMPNTPAAIGRGITAAAAAPAVSGAQRRLADGLLRAGGDTVWLEAEADLDAVTALSGSGPAYVFALAEAMASAGRAEGLDEAVSARLARQTVIGAAALLEQSEATPAELRAAVTSPGGTTAAGLEALRSEGGLDALIRRTVAAAARRSRALGG